MPNHDADRAAHIPAGQSNTSVGITDDRERDVVGHQSNDYEGPAYAAPQQTSEEHYPPERAAALPEPEKKGGVLSAFARFFAPAPKDREKATNAAQAKRARDKQKRQFRLGVRYGGDRMKWLMLQGGLAVLVVLSLLSFVIANGKATKGDIQAAVDQALLERGKDFPEGQAVMWAGQVARVWGTWDDKAPDTRKVLLAPYLSQGMDEQAGWNEQGKQEVVYASVNPEPDVIDANRAMVTVTYQIQDGTWRCADFPVYAYHPKEFADDALWAFALASNPVPIACTPRTGAPSLTSENDPYKDMTADTDTGQSLARDFFPGFFAAWAASDSSALTQYTAPGVQTLGLGGAMASVPPPTIGDTLVYVDKDGVKRNKVYDALVTVTWTVNGSTSEVVSTYVVPVKKQGDRWYVAGEPQAAAQTSDAFSGGPGAIPAPDDGGTTGGDYPNPTVSPTVPPSTVDPSTGAGDTAPPEDNKGDKKKGNGTQADPSGRGR